MLWQALSGIIFKIFMGASRESGRPALATPLYASYVQLIKKRTFKRGGYLSQTFF